MRNRFRSVLTLISIFTLLATGCSPQMKPISNVAFTKSVQASIKVDKVKKINDPIYNEQWYIFRSKSDKAWNILNGKKEVKVAIVDTGVDYNHPDLKNKVLTELGYNFINNSKETMDDNWHGTHVAGIIAAEAGNNIGITGVTGFADIKIIPVKALDKDGQGSSDIMAKGIKYAVDAGADVINFSVGFSVKDEYIAEAIKYAESKGVFVVASSGNDNINCDNTSPSGDKGAYTVTSVDVNDTKSNFANYGTSIKLSAPGEDILSTVPGGGYEYKSGTSMAAPIVAGVAAMMISENPSLSPKDIADILNKSAVDIMEEGKDDNTGYGIIDAYKAIELSKKIKSS